MRKIRMEDWDREVQVAHRLFNATLENMPNYVPMPEAEFRRLVAEGLNADEAQVVPEASFTEDLLADSIQLVDLMLELEEEGVEIPMEAAWQIQTVGDAYRFYAGEAD